MAILGAEMDQASVVAENGESLSVENGIRMLQKKAGLHRPAL